MAGFTPCLFSHTTAFRWIWKRWIARSSDRAPRENLGIFCALDIDLTVAIATYDPEFGDFVRCLRILLKKYPCSREEMNSSHRSKLTLLLQSCNVVNTPLIFSHTVLIQSLRPELAGPCGELAPFTLVFEPGNAVTAGIGDARHLHQNNGSRTFVSWKMSGQ